jgi:CRP-like cAMP-binding protein
MVPLKTLEQIDFLEGIPAEYLRPLARVAEVVEAPAGEVLFRQGEKSPSIYLLLEGEVALEIWVAGRGSCRIQTAGPGRLLGWTPLLADGLMTAGAKTLTPCRVVAINAMQVLEACAHNPHFGMELMRRTALALSRRLNATRQQLVEAYEEAVPVMSE